MTRDTSGKAPANDRDRYRGLESIPVRIVARVGGTRLSLERLSALRPGDVVTLDRPVGSPLDLMAGGRLLGRVDPVASGEGVGLKLVACAEDHDEPRS